MKFITRRGHQEKRKKGPQEEILILTRKTFSAVRVLDCQGGKKKISKKGKVGKDGPGGKEKRTLIFNQ